MTVAVTALAVAVVVIAIVLGLLAWGFHVVTKQRSAEREGRLDAVRDLGTARQVIAEKSDEIEKLGRALVFAADEHARLSKAVAAGAPDPVLLALARGLPANADGDGSVPADAAPELPTAPARPTGASRVPRPTLGFIDEELK